ncbi:hypothetical protein WDW86_09750 [Bdellovibrionota bacterium FG-2]
MNQFLVNGNPQPWPVPQTTSLSDLMNYFRKNCITRNELISTICVDGVNFSEGDQTFPGESTVAIFQKIEIHTSHPREMAEDTLQNLLSFAPHLEGLSLRTGRLIREGADANKQFQSLVNGMEIFTQGIAGVKKLLRIGLLAEVQVLEADLFSILRDLFEYQSAGQTQFVADLLESHLPMNLVDWQTRGIPAMIRSRDS